MHLGGPIARDIYKENWQRWFWHVHGIKTNKSIHEWYNNRPYPQLTIACVLVIKVWILNKKNPTFQGLIQYMKFISYHVQGVLHTHFKSIHDWHVQGVLHTHFQNLYRTISTILAIHCCYFDAPTPCIQFVCGYYRVKYFLSHI